MSNEIRIGTGVTGQTWTVKVKEVDGDQIGSDITLNDTNSDGEYREDFPSGSAVANTEYDIIFIRDSKIRATERRYWNGSKLLGYEDLITATGFSTHSATDVSSLLSGLENISVTTLVNGGSISVYKGDTWSFSVTVSGVTLTDYENVAFVAKTTPDCIDDDSILYLRTDTNIQRIGGSAPTLSTSGTLTINSDTQFTVLIANTETGSVESFINASWWLVGFDTTPTPDQKFHKVTGTFTVLDNGLTASV